MLTGPYSSCFVKVDSVSLHDSPDFGQPSFVETSSLVVGQVGCQVEIRCREASFWLVSYNDLSEILDQMLTTLHRTLERRQWRIMPNSARNRRRQVFNVHFAVLPQQKQRDQNNSSDR